MNDVAGTAEETPERARADHSAASRLAVLSFASGLILCCPGTGVLAAGGWNRRRPQGTDATGRLCGLAVRKPQSQGHDHRIGNAVGDLVVSRRWRGVEVAGDVDNASVVVGHAHRHHGVQLGPAWREENGKEVAT